MNFWNHIFKRGLAVVLTAALGLSGLPIGAWENAPDRTFFKGLIAPEMFREQAVPAVALWHIQNFLQWAGIRRHSFLQQPAIAGLPGYMFQIQNETGGGGGGQGQDERLAMERLLDQKLEDVFAGDKQVLRWAQLKQLTRMGEILLLGNKTRPFTIFAYSMKKENEDFKKRVWKKLEEVGLGNTLGPKEIKWPLEYAGFSHAVAFAFAKAGILIWKDAATHTRASVIKNFSFVSPSSLPDLLDQVSGKTGYVWAPLDSPLTLDVRHLPILPNRIERLEAQGIYTIGDLIDRPRTEVKRLVEREGPPQLPAVYDELQRWGVDWPEEGRLAEQGTTSEQNPDRKSLSSIDDEKVIDETIRETIKDGGAVAFQLNGTASSYFGHTGVTHVDEDEGLILRRLLAKRLDEPVRRKSVEHLRQAIDRLGGFPVLEKVFDTLQKAAARIEDPEIRRSVESRRIVLFLKPHPLWASGEVAGHAGNSSIYLPVDLVLMVMTAIQRHSLEKDTFLEQLAMVLRHEDSHERGIRSGYPDPHRAGHWYTSKDEYERTEKLWSVYRDFRRFALTQRKVGLSWSDLLYHLRALAYAGLIDALQFDLSQEQSIVRFATLSLESWAIMIDRHLSALGKDMETFQFSWDFDPTNRQALVTGVEQMSSLEHYSPGPMDAANTPSSLTPAHLPAWLKPHWETLANVYQDMPHFISDGEWRTVEEALGSYENACVPLIIEAAHRGLLEQRLGQIKKDIQTYRSLEETQGLKLSQWHALATHVRDLMVETNESFLQERKKERPMEKWLRAFLDVDHQLPQEFLPPEMREKQQRRWVDVSDAQRALLQAFRPEGDAVLLGALARDGTLYLHQMGDTYRSSDHSQQVRLYGAEKLNELGISWVAALGQPSHLMPEDIRLVPTSIDYTDDVAEQETWLEAQRVKLRAHFSDQVFASHAGGKSGTQQLQELNVQPMDNAVCFGSTDLALAMALQGVNVIVVEEKSDLLNELQDKIREHHQVLAKAGGSISVLNSRLDAPKVHAYLRALGDFDHVIVTRPELSWAQAAAHKKRGRGSLWIGEPENRREWEIFRDQYQPVGFARIEESRNLLGPNKEPGLLLILKEASSRQGSPQPDASWQWPPFLSIFLAMLTLLNWPWSSLHLPSQKQPAHRLTVSA